MPRSLLTYRHQDLLASDEKYIMHGCNNQGLMESGIAAAIAKKWPVVFQEYRNHYERDGLPLGSFHIVRGEGDRPYVINAITQRQGGIPLSYDALVKIFTDLNTVNLGKDRVLAIPKIGAGVAGGSWEIVEQIILNCVKTYTVRVYILLTTTPVPYIQGMK